MGSKNRLADYRSKRDPRSSGEPTGGAGPQRDQPLFVIQRHDASSLHFDFRLEVDGALTSWAVPKGPSVDPRDKRLATRVEDHPLDYAEFEGVIPEGYGAGTVIVWDLGGYTNETEHDGKPVPMADALERGHVRVRLDGHKLSGSFALTRTKMRGDDRNWLLVKIDDEGADRRRKPANTQLESVLSGRTNEQVGRS